MSGFGLSKCILLLGDEGVTAYSVSATQVKELDVIPWETEDFSESLASVIRKKAGGGSVAILNDLVEQHYRKERIPAASALDKASMIKRRLNAAFPAYPLKTAWKTKEKPIKGKAETQGGDVYLFAASALSDHISQTLDAVRLSGAGFSGFVLLPVESAGMGEVLLRKISKFSEKPAPWTLFVGQHKGGGLRQIVTKGGELALTRMTPIADGLDNPDLWAQEVASEIKATMSYLSRFGFDSQDGLDIIVIAEEDLGRNLTETIDFDCSLNILSYDEAVKALSVPANRAADFGTAQDLHVAWLFKKGKLSHPLQATQLDQIARPSRVALVAMVVLGISTAYLAYTFTSLSTNLVKTNTELAQAKAALQTTTVEHAAALEQTKALGYDFNLVEGTVETYRALERNSASPLFVFDRIGRALGADVRITSLIVRPEGQTLATGGVPPQSSPPQDIQSAEADSPKPDKFDVVIKFVFPSTLRTEEGVRLVSDIEARLKQELPNHQVSIVKQVADLTYTGNFVGEAGVTSQPTTTPENYEAEIKITGALQ